MKIKTINQSLRKEMDTIGRLIHPHLLYPDNSPELSLHITTISQRQALLLKPSTLEEAAVVAGLSSANVVYIFLNDTLEKKELLIKFFKNQEKIQKALELAKKIKNEDNFIKVKQYIDARAKHFN
jgi:nickel-dependent lactate racemase